MGAMDPRQAPDEAAAAIAPDVTLDPVAPYMMLTGGIRPGTPIPAPAEWTAETARAVHAQMVEALSGWHPALQGLSSASSSTRCSPPTSCASTRRRRGRRATSRWSGTRSTRCCRRWGWVGTPHCVTRRCLRTSSPRRSGRPRPHSSDRGLRGRHARLRLPDHGMSADHDRFGGGGLRKKETAERTSSTFLAEQAPVTTLPGEPVPYVIEAGSGRAHVLLGEVGRALVGAEESDGAMSVMAPRRPARRPPDPAALPRQRVRVLLLPARRGPAVGRRREPRPAARRLRLHPARHAARLPAARPRLDVRRPGRARRLGPLLRPHR